MEINDQSFSTWCRSRGIVAIYRYGSVTRNQARVDSDLDLAILLNPGVSLTLEQEAELAFTLEEHLRPLLKANREFDIRFLRNAPPAFQFQVLKARDLIWEGDPTERVRFERGVLREYLDFRHYEDIHREAMRQRLREGTFGCRPPIRG